MSVAKDYIDGLHKAYIREGGEKLWDDLFKVCCGVDDDEKAALISMYPDIPESLVELLKTVDGTYWRDYGIEEVTFYFFGSDVDDGKYPYYLYSALQLIGDAEQDYGGNFADLADFAEEEPDSGCFVDERVRTGDGVEWLCFSDCMNNGGTSSLFIDFTPSEKGIKGQIVRFLHDPDRLDVIADSFDDFLRMLMDTGYRFVDREYFE